VPNRTHGVRYRPSPERESADQLGGRIEKSARRVVAGCLDAVESFDMQVELSQPTKAWPRQIRSYAELQEQLHHDLRAQHPEWIDANGNSPMVDWYDQRLAELITIFQSANRNPMKRAAKPAINIALAA
jgi:hypothetical protein